MKLDKETVIKQRFWFALGFFVVLWVVAFFVMKVGGAAEVKAKQDAYKKSKDEIEKFKSPKNERFVKPWNAHKAVFEGQKKTVWEKAWDGQKEMITWPWPASSRLHQTVLYPSDQIPMQDRVLYESTYYKRQFYDDQGNSILKDIVAPVELQGGVDAIVPPQEWQKNTPPTREEIWLAQEDFWVRRELLQTVKDALDAIRQMSREPVKDLPKGVLARWRFRNESAGWELDLRVEPGPDGKGARQLVIGKDSTIKNIHASRRIQPLMNPRTAKPLAFELRQGQAKSRLTVEGEPLAPEASVALGKATRPLGIDLRKPFDMEQVFEWENCPIRRIDAIELVKQSHRTFTMDLKQSPVLEEVAKQDAGPAAEGDTTGGAPGGMPGMPGGASDVGPGGPGMPGMPGGPMGGKFGRGEGMPGMGGMGGGVMNPTPLNGLERNRYIAATDQCRHMPLGMVLIVDQSYVPDVLTAIANSPLRIQITQVEFHHIPGIQREEGAATPGGSGMPGAPPGMPGMARMAGAAGMRRPQGGPGFAGPIAGGMARPGRGGLLGGRGKELGEDVRGARGAMKGTAARPGMPGAMPGMTTETDADTGEEDSNLVELGVYGVAALYERYPPKPKEDKPADTGTPGAPAAGAAPAKP